ncbi:hypothetical protein GCM10022234_09050 [Aeromicrobium panaciterrae]|uniref:DUF2867 domain-containing protein n=1 Tax=Aeromicrobium panaciterrae TaxID=363861 RepID=UPI0031D62F41
MRLPRSAHDEQGWRIAEIAPDFEVEDVWALPVHGGPDDFPQLLEVMAHLSSNKSPSRVSRALFAIRWKLGAWLGWDDEKLPIPGDSSSSLIGRLPQDLRDSTDGFDFDSLPFDPLYRTEREAAAEISNKTVHAMMHLGWVDKGHGDNQGQMAVLVKPRGRFGTVYMDLIKPFRHAIVYPALMRQIEQAWNSRDR